MVRPLLAACVLACATGVLGAPTAAAEPPACLPGAPLGAEAPCPPDAPPPPPPPPDAPEPPPPPAPPQPRVAMCMDGSISLVQVGSWGPCSGQGGVGRWLTS